MADNASKIDSAVRRRTATIYRHFAAGLLTTDEMEDALPVSPERRLNDIFGHGIWTLYDDRHEHRLTGQHRLTSECRRHVARIILFLHSDLSYRWPPGNFWKSIAELTAGLLTLGLWRPFPRSMRGCGGDASVWPFFDRADYDAALQRAPFLHGSRGC